MDYTGYYNALPYEKMKNLIKSGRKISYDELYNLPYNKKEENWEPYIEKVIFNPPATIVFWKSGGKTVVKCNEPDEYDKAKGVALCYMKKALMNSSGEFNKQLRKAGVYYTEEDKGE